MNNNENVLVHFITKCYS